MKIFKDYTFKWWQISLLKLSLALIGIVIGAYWQDFFLPHIEILLAIGIAIALYITFVIFTE